jgi:hypothetical protein
VLRDSAVLSFPVYRIIVGEQSGGGGGTNCKKPPRAFREFLKRIATARKSSIVTKRILWNDFQRHYGIKSDFVFFTT